MSLDRRSFARRLALGSGAFATGAGLSPAQERVNPGNVPPRPMPPRRPAGAVEPVFGTNERMHVRTAGALRGDGWFHEAARDIPVAGDFDTIVCGAGPAGFAAALAAARSGAKTALIEVHGCVGGIWTAGMLSWILDGNGKPGIMSELLKRLAAEKNGRFFGGAWVYHPEPMKLMLEEMLVEAGVTLRLFTRVVGAVADEGRRLSAIVTESKSGREGWTARNFIDATGDGDLAAQAGCGFDFGRPGDGVTQPMSLMALFVGVKTDEIAPFVNHVAEERKLGRGKSNFLAELRRAGVEPSYGGPSIFEIHDGLYAMMANHQYQVSAINADDVTRATLEARRENHALIAALRKLGGPWRGAEIICTGEQIGTREARRIHGRYTVTDEDLKNGATFDDGICHVKFPIDVHSTDPGKTKEIESKPFKSQPYDIPLRSLLAKDLDGLMLAGRCISGGFIAHSSYRVTGNAVAMGEAAGLTCAIAAREGALPHEVPFEELKRAPKA
ncbi:MAG: FAD-dependent oxidoreductase [Verrucomicrobiales bacterium]|nr:FAD-dependent oxidoreductase [Verrucomicrobiales bacterium]